VTGCSFLRETSPEEGDKVKVRLNCSSQVPRPCERGISPFYLKWKLLSSKYVDKDICAFRRITEQTEYGIEVNKDGITGEIADFNSIVQRTWSPQASLRVTYGARLVPRVKEEATSTSRSDEGVRRESQRLHYTGQLLHLTHYKQWELKLSA